MNNVEKFKNHSMLPLAQAEQLRKDFCTHALDETFPCIFGQSVVRRKGYSMGIYDKMDDLSVGKTINNDLYDFIKYQDELFPVFAVYIAIFSSHEIKSEQEFDVAMWTLLKQMHMEDIIKNDWDPTVSNDPLDPNFSFSIGGRGFFVLGMNPKARSKARRFISPALVFNARILFDHLRHIGKYASSKSLIRKRDASLNGYENPDLADFGVESEAKQFSGRAVEHNWKPPIEISFKRFSTDVEDNSNE